MERTYETGISTDIRACFINKLYDALMYEETPYELFVRHSLKGKSYRRVSIFCNPDNADYFAWMLHKLEDVVL